MNNNIHINGHRRARSENFDNINLGNNNIMNNINNLGSNLYSINEENYEEQPKR